MTRAEIERYKDLYARGLWTDRMLDMLLKKKKLTEDEYNEIKSARD